MKCQTLTSISFLLLTALLVIGLTGCAPTTTPSLMTDATSITVPETASATFQVKLSLVPSADVTVTVSRTSGDSDITVQSGGSLTFTTSNWSAYQTVTLAAAADADTTNGTATVRCSATGYSNVDVTATEADDDSGSNEGETVHEGEGEGEIITEGEPSPGATETILLPGNVPLDMVWIPGGTFQMGAYEGGAGQRFW
jgi:hypothetical protein